MDKKKLEYGELQSWHLFILLFIIPFVFFFYILSPNSLAFTENEFITICDDCIDKVNSTFNKTYSSFSDLIFDGNQTVYDNFFNNLENYNYFYANYAGTSNNSIRIYFYETISEPVQLNSYNRYSAIGSRTFLYFSNDTYGIVYNSNAEFTYYSPNVDLNIYYNFDFKDYSGVLHEANYEVQHVPVNSITLVSSSNHKFGFNDFNQCNVYITGDWDFYSDFTFMLQRYIDNDWEDFAGSLEYLKLLDHANPYYVFWPNMNYYPVGTYRYRALLNDSPDTYFYSESFQITNSIIDNEGSATGTYNNGDIDIDVNIDTGKTVDNIKDFLGESPSTTESQFKDNFPEVEVEDPSDDFFSWVFDQVENIFTSTTPQSLSFDLFENTYTFSSNDIFVPNNALKTLVGLSCDFSILYWIIKDIRKVINKIKEGSIETLADDDITANMV